MTCQVQRWKDLWQWLPTEGDAGLSAMADTVPLGDFLTRVQTPIDKNRFPLDELNIIDKITFGGDLKIRPPKRKVGYKGPLFRADTGDLIISKIRVAQGSLCIVPSSLDHVAVSNEYPVYRPDQNQVHPAFLSLLLRSAQFQCALRSLRSGNTTKARLKPIDFEALPMPLPDPKNQRSLVATYQKAQDKAARLDQQAQQIERDAQREFEAALGLTPPPDLPKRPFQITRYRDIERWSHEGILHRAISATKGSREGPPEALLGDLIDDIENGWSVQCATRPAKDDEWAILKISAVSSGVFKPDQNKALPAKFKPRPTLEVHAGDLLITRCNIAHLVGVSALVQDVPPRLMLCDKIFRVLFRQDSPICAAYLNAVLKTPDLRQQIEGKVTGTSPTMKNISKQSLMELLIPVPDVPVQERLSEAWEGARKFATAKRKQATALRAAAWSDFIAAVFA
ncbi:MAG: hypothetical protein ACOYOU_00670 [Kiritimatiellia bacterium]